MTRIAVTAEKIADAAAVADAGTRTRFEFARGNAFGARESLMFLSKTRPKPRGALSRNLNGEDRATADLRDMPFRLTRRAADLGALALMRTVPMASRVDALEGAFSLTATAHYFGTVESYSPTRLIAGTRHLDDAIPRLTAAESREFAAWRDAGMTERPAGTGPEITAEQVAYALPRSMDDIPDARMRMDALVQTLETGRVVHDDLTASVNDVFADLGL